LVVEVIEEPREHRQVIAQAGSGKTQRIAELIADSVATGTPPGSIVATTYGVQAAQELRERILLVAGQRLGPMPGLSQMTVGTIHSVCLGLLKRHLPRYISYRLLTEAQVYLLVKENYHALGLDRVRLVDGPHAGDPLERTAWDLRAYLDVLTVLREGDVDWGKMPAPLKESCRRFKHLMRRERALDHTGLLHQALHALGDTDDEHCRRLRAHIVDNVRALYVDEYQDVNPIQERLIRAFVDLGVAVTTVGDGNQAIYGWRGCDVRYVTSFADRYHARVERLDTNYRSSPGVITAAHHLLGSQAGEQAMTAGGHQVTEAGDLQAGQFDNLQEEADYIVGRIQDMIGTPFQDRLDDPPRGLTYSDVAVLCRSVRQSAGAIVEALTAAGIPCRVSGLGGLFAAPEVRAVVASFLFLADRPELVREGGKVVGRRVVTAGDVVQAWRDADLGLSAAETAGGAAYLVEQKARYGQKLVGAGGDGNG